MTRTSHHTLIIFWKGVQANKQSSRTIGHLCGILIKRGNREKQSTSSQKVENNTLPRALHSCFQKTDSLPKVTGTRWLKSTLVPDLPHPFLLQCCSHDLQQVRSFVLPGPVYMILLCGYRRPVQNCDISCKVIVNKYRWIRTKLPQLLQNNSVYISK